MTTVLFACIHNAGRSQMAAAFFNALADPSQARAISAGTTPADRAHPEVVATMDEVGLDLAAVRPQAMSSVSPHEIDLLITMGCGQDACPVAPGARTDDWPLDDPKGQSTEHVRAIRDAIQRRVEQLITTEGWNR